MVFNQMAVVAIAATAFIFRSKNNLFCRKEAMAMKLKKHELLKISIDKINKKKFTGQLRYHKLKSDELESIKEWIIQQMDRAIEDLKNIEES